VIAAYDCEKLNAILIRLFKNKTKQGGNQGRVVLGLFPNKPKARTQTWVFTCLVKAKTDFTDPALVMPDPALEETCFQYIDYCTYIGTYVYTYMYIHICTCVYTYFRF
jgi:hypothetical protein